MRKVQDDYADVRFLWKEFPMFNDAAKQVERRLNRRFKARQRKLEEKAERYGE